MGAGGVAQVIEQLLSKCEPCVQTPNYLCPHIYAFPEFASVIDFFYKLIPLENMVAMVLIH
jgi:hypothetical protein